MNEISVLNLILEAGIVVKIVMLILFIASILSWIVIVCLLYTSPSPRD